MNQKVQPCLHSELEWIHLSEIRLGITNIYATFPEVVTDLISLVSRCSDQ